MTKENRKTKRFPVSLKVWITTPDGEAEGFTRSIGRNGFSFVGDVDLRVGEKAHAALYLLDGNVVEGKIICRSNNKSNQWGFSFKADATSEKTWSENLDWEEAHGSMWRMASRFNDEDERVSTLPIPYDDFPDGEDQSLESKPVASSAGENGNPDGRSVVFDLPTTDVHTVEPLPEGNTSIVREADEVPDSQEAAVSHRLRLYTVGEGGEAYRLAFEMHESDAPTECDLKNLRGFVDVSRRAIKRILRREMTIRFDSRSPAMGIRVVEMKRGGYAYVQGLDDGNTPVGLGSLAIGELVVIEVNDVRVFPYFEEPDLELIAKDAFRFEREKTALLLSDIPLKVLSTGIDAIREAQADSIRMEQRIYGNRTLTLYPDVLVRTLIDGNALQGPTMADPEKNRVLLLALVGVGAPRVVPLSEDLPMALVTPDSATQ
ncbi:MAG: PilZ domain-containing protein [Deltaproteobacteria bacterium]|nr:PilZ domain-containing protein [Deltaproteobacteria bacterium]